MKPDKEFIKENCEHMIKIIDAFKNCEKDELNDLENMFDTMKEDLISSMRIQERRFNSNKFDDFSRRRRLNNENKSRTI